MIYGRRHFGCAFCAAAGFLATGCVTDDTVGSGSVAPGYKPLASTDEGGLWAMMDRAEQDLRRSRAIVRDPALMRYVTDLVCRLGRDHCADLRVYVIRVPHFNASMAPNGMMQVWTGLLLRVQDEAQLAAVIGHEMGHYLERHTLQRFRTLKATADFAAFLSLGLALAGNIGSAVNDLAQAVMIAGFFAYTREQERDADRIGSDLMARAGLARVRAADLWEQLIAELAATSSERPRDIFTATHPDPSERARNLHEMAASQTGGETARERLRSMLSGLRTTLLQDELRLRQPARTLVVLEQLRSTASEDAELVFCTGEVYRLRDDEGDAARARTAYEQALTLRQAPVETWRSLGLVARRSGDRAAADAAFRRYLELAPGASDRRIIQSYLSPED